MKKQSCRNCEYFVPRAGMCVESRSCFDRKMPLRRAATDVCQHHIPWIHSDGETDRLQMGDRMAAFPKVTIRVDASGGLVSE